MKPENSKKARTMPPKVYIDGHVGTTGLRIREWLAGRNDIELLALAEAQRKSDAARRAVLDEADVAILCLPDAASREAAGWAAHTDTRLIDASTAHRVEDGLGIRSAGTPARPTRGHSAGKICCQSRLLSLGFSAVGPALA